MPNNTIPTKLQQDAVKKIFNEKKSPSKAMAEVGYKPKTAKNPKNLTKSKGYQELCKQYGLTDKLLLGSLVEDIKKKKQDRKAELELGFKIKGRLKEEPPVPQTTINIQVNKNTLNIINNAEKQLEEEMRKGIEGNDNRD